MTDTTATRTAPVTYAMINRQVTINKTVYFTVLTKTSDDIRRYPSRDGRRYATRSDAVQAAERAGYIVIKHWYDAELTAAEVDAQYR